MGSVPRLYAITNNLAAGEALLRAGVKLLQYRHKGAFDRARFEECARLAEICRAAGAMFIVNDRTDVAVMCGADGVHVGQDDLPPEAVRRVLGGFGAGKIVGYSTHSEAQARAADALPVDYVAIGPVFATTTKENPDPVVGLAGVAAARRVTSKPLVAIGGITRENAASVLAAGADSVAVVRDLVSAPDIEAAARDFLKRLR